MGDRALRGAEGNRLWECVFFAIASQHPVVLGDSLDKASRAFQVARSSRASPDAPDGSQLAVEALTIIN